MAYAAPNNLIGEYTVNVALSSTSATSLLSNAASSGRVFKVIAIVAANVDGTNAADISVSRYSAAALGGTAFPLASTISVPADASLIVADSTTPIMLAANTSLGATAGTGNAITMTVTYQEYAG
jgi:hypothetical protein